MDILQTFCVYILGLLLCGPLIAKSQGKGMSFTPPVQLVAVDSNMTIISETPPNYSHEARFDILHNGRLIKKFWTKGTNTDPRFTMVHNDTYDTLGVKYEQVAELEDGGVYMSILDPESRSPDTANVTVIVVEGDSRPVFVENGSTAEFGCLVASSLDDMDWFVCRWYINRVEQDGGNCTHMAITITEFTGHEVMCKVTLRQMANSSRETSAGPDNLIVPFNKSLIVAWCDEIPRTLPSRVTCWLVGNLLSGLQMEFVDTSSGTSIISSCEMSDTQRNCSAQVPVVKHVSVRVLQDGEVELQIPLTKYLEEETVTPDGPDGDSNWWWVAILVIGILVIIGLVVFTFEYKRRKHRWWWKDVGALRDHGCPNCMNRNRDQRGGTDVKSDAADDQPTGSAQAVANESRIELLDVKDDNKEQERNGAAEMLQDGKQDRNGATEALINGKQSP